MDYFVIFPEHLINLVVFRFLFLSFTITFSYFLFNFIRKNRDLQNHQKSFLSASIIDQTPIGKIDQLYSKVFNQGYALCDHGKDLIKKGEIKKGIALMEKGFLLNKAPKPGQSLAFSYAEVSNYKRVEELFKFNTGNEPYRFKPLMNLFALYKKVNDYENIERVGKKIIDLPIKIPSKKIDRFKKLAKITLTNNKEKTFNIKGTLSDWSIIFSEYLKRDNKYKIYLPKVSHIKEKIPVIYMTDGQRYAKSSRFIETIDEMIESKKIKPLSIVFIDPRDISNSSVNYRQEYYLCNPNYISFLEKELIPKIDSQYPISNNREDRAIMGHSFGGLFSAYLGCKAPNLFKNIIMQSPAFHPCPEIYENYRNSNKMDLKMYLSYGTGNDTADQDLPMVEILQNKNYNLKINEVKDGNHDWDIWMNQTEEIMTYFFGIE